MSSHAAKLSAWNDVLILTLHNGTLGYRSDFHLQPEYEL
jgi:hypothetical protein